MNMRLTNMKYIAVIAVALLSFVVAIPVSKEPIRQHIQLDSSPVKTETKTKVSIKTTPVVQPTATHTQAVQPVTQPTSAVQPAPQAATASFSCENYKSLFDQYSWNVSTAMAICQAESSGNPSAVGCHNYDGVCDYGLMQIHGVDILDPAANISYAYYHKYLTQGWGAWTTYTDGQFQQYL